LITSRRGEFRAGSFLLGKIYARLEAQKSKAESSREALVSKFQPSTDTQHIAASEALALEPPLSFEL
jgi:hypothetical protein